jgi:hypothetical protein
MPAIVSDLAALVAGTVAVWILAQIIADIVAGTRR